MSYLKEFRDWPEMYEAKILTHDWDFSDESWHNDAAPRFVSPDRRINIWIEHPDPKFREMPHRFCIDRIDIVDGEEMLTDEVVLATDSWSDVMAWVEKEYGLDFTSNANGLVEFNHDSTSVFAPHLSECGRSNVDPSYYGFNVWETGGGCTAWGRNFGRYYMLVTHHEDASHDLEGAGWNVAVGVYERDSSDALVDYILDPAGAFVPGTMRRFIGGSDGCPHP